MPVRMLYFDPVFVLESCLKKEMGGPVAYPELLIASKAKAPYCVNTLEHCPHWSVNINFSAVQLELCPSDDDIGVWDPLKPWFIPL